METRNNKMGVMVATLVIGGVLGGIGGYSAGASMKSSDNASMMSPSPSSSMMSSSADGTTVGGARMVKDKDIVDNAAAASNVKTLVSLVKTAGLVDTLKMSGPFTVFGPNDDAFAKLDTATLDTLQKPENVGLLKNILTYHVIPGTYTSADLKVMAQKGESLTSVQGEKVMPVMKNNALMLMDAKGNSIEIETADVISSNGVTHVIKSVMMPAK